MKKHFNKEFVITEENDKNVEGSTKRCTCDNSFVEGDVKIRDHFQVTKTYRGAAHGDCNIKVSLNYKIQNYCVHLI